ncbi:hypothetical protein BCR43DRAFT_481153, partial [Syncephalastrum racemosum]
MGNRLIHVCAHESYYISCKNCAVLYCGATYVPPFALHTRVIWIYSSEVACIPFDVAYTSD